jgi:hypothetical protein
MENKLTEQGAFFCGLGCGVCLVIVLLFLYVSEEIKLDNEKQSSAHQEDSGYHPAIIQLDCNNLPKEWSLDRVFMKLQCDDLAKQYSIVYKPAR